MSDPISNNDVVIIGAGIAGLSAGLHLAERGVSTIILEADPEFPGGRIAGGAIVDIDGWQFRGEHGVHGIWSPYLNLQAMLARHSIRPVFVPAMEEAWIYKRGNAVKKAAVGTAIRYSPLPAPLHYLNLFARPSFLRMLDIRDWFSLPLVWIGLLWGVGVDPLAEEQPLAGMTLKDMVKNWSPGVRAFFVGLARNGLSAKPDEIPLSGFIAFLRFYTLLRRDTWIFSYLPADGGTSLVDPLVKKYKELGGTLQLGSRAAAIKKHADKWEVSYLIETPTGGQDTKTISAQHLILAADAHNTRALVEASPDLGDSEGYYWPRGLETAAIRIWYDSSPEPGPEGGIFSGDFIIDNFFWLHKIQDQYIRWHRATGGSAIEVHIYGPSELLQQADAALIAQAAADVQNSFPELRGRRIHQMIERNPGTHTLFGVGPRNKHLGIDSPWPGIYCCGDWVRHSTPAFFLERACVTGIYAANALLESTGKEPWPTLEYPAPEPLARFIEKAIRRGRRKRKRKGNSKTSQK